MNVLTENASYMNLSMILRSLVSQSQGQFLNTATYRSRHETILQSLQYDGRDH